MPPLDLAIRRDRELCDDQYPSNKGSEAPLEHVPHRSAPAARGRFSQITLTIFQEPFHLTSSRKSTHVVASIRTTASFPKTLRTVTESRHCSRGIFPVPARVDWMSSSAVRSTNRLCPSLSM